MLVHRMVKNVKDSKVLEKIRTRDAHNLADLQDVNYKGYLISLTYDGWFFVLIKSASGGWKLIPNAKFGNIDQAKAFIDSHPVKDSKTKDMKDSKVLEKIRTRDVDFIYRRVSIKQIAPNKFEGVSGYETGKVGGYVSAKFTASSIEEMKRDIDRWFSDNTRAVDSRTKDMKVTIMNKGEMIWQNL